MKSLPRKKSSVVSKLKCPVFVAHDMSGSWSMDRRRGCGKVGIPRLFAGFPSAVENLFLVFHAAAFPQPFPGDPVCARTATAILARCSEPDDVWPYRILQVSSRCSHTVTEQPASVPANASARSEKLFLPPRPYYPGSPRAAVAREHHVQVLSPTGQKRFARLQRRDPKPLI